MSLLNVTGLNSVNDLSDLTPTPALNDNDDDWYGYLNDNDAQTSADVFDEAVTDSFFLILAILLIVRCCSRMREIYTDDSSNNNNNNNNNNTSWDIHPGATQTNRLDRINDRFEFTTIQKPSSTEISSGSDDTEPTNEGKDPEPGNHKDDPEDPKISSSERHHTATASGSGSGSSTFVSAVSSLFTSMRTIRGGQPPPQEECCSICLEPYGVGDTVATLKPSCESTCKHKFHKDCLMEWLEHHDECPLCRVNMVGTK